MRRDGRVTGFGETSGGFPVIFLAIDEREGGVCSGWVQSHGDLGGLVFVYCVRG